MLLARSFTLPPDESLAPGEVALLEKAGATLVARHRGNGPPVRAIQLVAEAQTRAVPAGELEVSALVAEALGRVAYSLEAGEEVGAEALGRYLAVEADERRAIVAGRALRQLFTDQAEVYLLRARARFGDESAFWAAVGWRDALRTRRAR